MKVFIVFLLTSSLLTKTPVPEVPHFHSSTELSAYVRNSIDQDLETLNLLDRATSTPRRSQKNNRRLKAQKPQKRKTRSNKSDRRLEDGLFSNIGEGLHEATHMINPMNYLKNSDYGCLIRGCKSNARSFECDGVTIRAGR